MQADRLGTVLRDGERVGMRYVRQLRHPPERVWRALTESEQLRHWMPTDLVGERRAGAALSLPFWSPFIEKYGIATPTLTGEIRIWEPPRVFEWTWDTDVLRWELEPTPTGTALTFTTWLGAADDREQVHKTAAGYHACLAGLAELLDTGAVAVALLDQEMGPVEALYEAQFTDGAFAAG